MKEVCRAIRAENRRERERIRRMNEKRTIKLGLDGGELKRKKCFNRWRQTELAYCKQQGQASFIVNAVHPDLKARFTVKCQQDGFSTSARIRWLIIKFAQGKINNEKLQKQMGDANPNEDFGPLPKASSQRMSVSGIPKVFYKEFARWCALRGISMSWKVKQLMMAYINNLITT